MGWSNVPKDLDCALARLAIRAYYLLPDCLHAIIVHQAPRPAIWFYKLIRPLLPSSIIKSLYFVRGTEIHDLIAPERLPDFISGTGESLDQDYRLQVPANCLDAESCMRYHGVDADLYETRIKPQLRQMIRVEFAAYPHQLANQTSQFLKDDDDH